MILNIWYLWFPRMERTQSYFLNNWNFWLTNSELKFTALFSSFSFFVYYANQISRWTHRWKNVMLTYTHILKLLSNPRAAIVYSKIKSFYCCWLRYSEWKMVFFTCNHCGESLKKPAVEKHYQWKSCRGKYKKKTNFKLNWTCWFKPIPNFQERFRF